MFNLGGKQPDWSRTPDPETRNEILDLDQNLDYEFHDSNKAFANTVFARLNGGESLYPDHPVTTLDNPTIRRQAPGEEVIVVDEENDPDLKAAIAASLSSLAEYKQRVEASLAELECSERKNSRVDSQMEVSELEDELTASQMLDEDVFALRERLHGSCTAAQLSESLHMFENLSLTDTDRLCRDLDLESLETDSATTFTKAFVQTMGNVTHASCCCTMRHVWQKKLKDLSKNASRALIGCLSDVISKYPAAAMETVLLPVWMEPDFRNTHSDLLNKLLKTCSPDYKATLAREIFVAKLSGLSESHVAVLQTVFTMKIKCTAQSMESLLSTLEKATETMSKNNKFAKLLLTILESPNEQALSASKPVLSRCVTAQETMLKSSLERALQKL